MKNWIKTCVFIVSILIDLNSFGVSQDSILDVPEKGRKDGCYQIGRGPGSDIDGNPGLGLFIKGLTEDLKKEKWSSLYKHFHERARVKKGFGDRVEAILGHRYQKPRDISVYGVWSIVSQEGKRNLYECPKADQMRLISHSGYKNQYMVIYQLMANNELGRLVFSIAGDSKKRLRIVGFHIQQWSHQGKDWLSWTEDGNKYTKDGNQKSAYIHFDIAQKLLDGGTLLHYPYRKEILAARDQIFTQKKLVNQIQKDINNKNVIYVGTVLSRTDTGIFVKVALEKEYNAEDLRNMCTMVGQSLVGSHWLKDINGGVNCNYLPKGVDPKTKSKLGGYYISRDRLGPKN